MSETRADFIARMHSLFPKGSGWQLDVAVKPTWPGKSLLRNMTTEERLRYELPLTENDIYGATEEQLQNRYDEGYESGYDDGQAAGVKRAKQELIDHIREFEF